MAEVGLSTLGITLWAAVSENGEKITDADSYTQLTRINQIGEITVEPEAIDASALEDYETKNIAGRSTVTDSYAITVNDTDETMTEWEALLGKKVCFLTKVPGKTKQNFVIAEVPTKIPASSLDQNGLLTFVMNCTTNNFIGWDTAVDVGKA
jgi:hypothetical protein